MVFVGTVVRNWGIEHESRKHERGEREKREELGAGHGWVPRLDTPDESGYSGQSGASVRETPNPPVLSRPTPGGRVSGQIPGKLSSFRLHYNADGGEW